MKCGIGLYASYGMESNRKTDRRRDKLPSGEGAHKGRFVENQVK
jgi:hypothetical protein